MRCYWSTIVQGIPKYQREREERVAPACAKKPSGDHGEITLVHNEFQFAFR